MRVLITGSSGQIGTNLALRLQREGHEVFGVDKRPNAWTDAFPHLLQDLTMQHVELDFPPCDAIVHSYARCYGLPYLVFRFSNVYGRFDNDLHRMVRVIPLFIHRLRRGEPITVYGGEQKTLDFTYVDDCVDGIAAGIDALVAGRVQNETINLAYGGGNTLVRVAELIAARLDVAPRMAIA